MWPLFEGTKSNWIIRSCKICWEDCCIYYVFAHHHWVLSLVMFYQAAVCSSCLFLCHFPFSFILRNQLDSHLGTDLAIGEPCTSFKRRLSGCFHCVLGGHCLSDDWTLNTSFTLFTPFWYWWKCVPSVYRMWFQNQADPSNVLIFFFKSDLLGFEAHQCFIPGGETTPQHNIVCTLLILKTCKMCDSSNTLFLIWM